MNAIYSLYICKCLSSIKWCLLYRRHTYLTQKNSIYHNLPIWRAPHLYYTKPEKTYIYGLNLKCHCSGTRFYFNTSCLNHRGRLTHICYYCWYRWWFVVCSVVHETWDHKAVILQVTVPQNYAITSNKLTLALMTLTHIICGRLIPAKLDKEYALYIPSVIEYNTHLVVDLLSSVFTVRFKTYGTFTLHGQWHRA